MSDTDNSEFDKRVARMKSPVNYLSPCCDSSYASGDGMNYSSTVQVPTRKGSPVTSSEKRNDNKHKKSDTKQKGRSKKDKAGGSITEDERKPSAKPKVGQGHSLARPTAQRTGRGAKSKSILMPKIDGIVTKRKKDIFSLSDSSTGSDDILNFAAMPAKNVSSQKDCRKSSSASHKKVRSKKDERSSVLDDGRKPSAKPKSRDQSASRTAAVINRERAKQNSSGQMPVRKCQKEGCNNTLTKYQIIRCGDHKNICKREGCDKRIQNREKGLCRRHAFELESCTGSALAQSKARASEERPVRYCQKEGCDKELTGAQIIRCEKHANKCKREGCTISIYDRESGLCHYHRCPVLECQKEGCKAILEPNQKIRCRDHKHLCKRKGCTKMLKYDGLCLEHWKAATGQAHVCQKVGCNTTLKGCHQIRCSEHKLECKLKSCKVKYQTGTDGFCRGHWKAATANAETNPLLGESNNKGILKGTKKTSALESKGQPTKSPLGKKEGMNAKKPDSKTSKMQER